MVVISNVNIDDMVEREVSVVLLSGGIDSCVATTLEAQEQKDVYLLSIDYESAPSKMEISARKLIAEWLFENYKNVKEHSQIKLEGYMNLRTIKKDGQVPQGYPFTRDEAFMLLGATWLENLLLHNDNYSSGKVVIATTKEDTKNFEDIRPEIYYHINGILKTKYANKFGKKMEVSTPLIDSMKHEVVSLGLQIKAPLQYTWSCYGEGPDPCKECDQCYWRADAFRKAGISDPAILVPKLLKTA
ncbi:7-cyano-7-deazaguanine synthase [Candidatus Woesearchaeota archaeon]|nr:7-cyano-7-deazaguanine synthase [Candidatus Woesearchaeota archaeon]